MQKQSFLQGALILMLAGFINRIMGFLLRIILIKAIGDEGLGLFQMVYPLFMTLLLIATAGFPLAISKLIPERLARDDLEGSYNYLKVTLLFVSFMSFLIAAFLFLSADFFASRVYSDKRIQIILLAIIPALIVSPLAACFRGFFQGMHTMIPTAASQITEQLSRFSATLVLINLVSHLGLKYQSAAVALGISIGETTGLILLIILFFKYLPPAGPGQQQGKKNKYRFSADFQQIAALAIPITLGRIVNSLMLSGEAILIPRQLQLKGLSISEATSLYGQLSGIVEQLLFLPTVITIALTTSLIPNVSAAYAHNNLEKIRNNYQDVIRISCYLGLPVSVIFMTRGREICNLLFGYPEAGNLLATMAFSATFIYYLQVSHGMLNGLGKASLALINLIIGSALKLFGIFFLTRQPIGIHGAALSIGLGYLLSAILNFIAIGYTIGYKLNISQCFLKPLFSSVLLFWINPYISLLPSWLPFPVNHHLETILSLLVMIFFYLAIMVLIKGITKEDLERFKGTCN